MKKIILLLISFVFLVAKCSDNSKSPVDNGTKNISLYVYNSDTNDITVYEGSSGYCEYFEHTFSDTAWKMKFYVTNNQITSENKMYSEVYLISLINIEILDEQPIGYVNILNQDELISMNNTWSDTKILLATTNDSIKTIITGEKYIGIRIKKGNDYCYGWVKINLHEYDDRIQILTNGYCYKTTLNESILAGQKE